MRVLSIGTMDLIHIGHINLINRCRDLGDEVYIGVNSDEFVERYKGKPPIMTEKERMLTLATIFPDVKVRLNSSEGRDLILDVDPDLLVIGSDWASRDYLAQIDVSQDLLDSNDISVLYVPYTHYISTTELKRRIHEN